MREMNIFCIKVTRKEVNFWQKYVPDSEEREIYHANRTYLKIYHHILGRNFWVHDVIEMFAKFPNNAKSEQNIAMNH